MNQEETRQVTARDEKWVPTKERVKISTTNDSSGVTCDGSPKVSIFSPLVSPSTNINMPRGVYSIDVAATFEVPLKTVGDLHKLINDIEAGKHDELLSGMTNDDRMETLDALDDSINHNVDESTIPSEPIVQYVDINTKSTSYAGASGASIKDQPKVNSNFRTLVVDLVFDGVNISIPRKVVKKEQLGETWAEKDYDEFQRLLFLLDVVLEGEVDLVDVVTIGIRSLSGDGFTKETIRVEYEWRPPRCDICINSYEFYLVTKKCLVDDEVFQKILDSCPRVLGEYSTEVPDDESTLTFLIDISYKGPLYKRPSMENVDYPELIWEDFAFQIDNRQMKKGKREIMPYPRLKFIRIGEDFQEYGLPIHETILTKGIKHSESYQMFIKYSTGLITPKKIRGKGSQEKKTSDTPEAAVDVRCFKFGKSISLTEAAEEEAARLVHATHERILIESNLEPARRRPSGISFRDTSNMSKNMSPDLSHKLKGIQTLTPKEKLAADTMQALKASKKSIRSPPHVGGSSEGTATKPGVPDESTVTPKTSSEGTGTKPRLPDEEKVTSEPNVILDWGSEQESEYTEEDDNDEKIEWVNTDEEEEKNDDDDDKSIDLEKTDDEFVHSEDHVQDDDEETDDESVHGDEQVNDDEDEEMTNVEDADTGNSDEEITDTEKADAEKTEEVKDDIKKAELPPT
ncbi:hypothetical protein Tco_0672456 [Tanacetum coccineum]